MVHRLVVCPLLWLSAVSCFTGDTVDTKTAILLSHFSQKIKEPLYVTYTLYKGGGNCSRSGMSFRNHRSDVQTATAKDYSHSGFDIGQHGQCGGFRPRL